ncbi:MAG: methyltransferase [Moorea sp. SIO3I7]|nr:methyltransferase [Moorena sp. SIO3I7]
MKDSIDNICFSFWNSAVLRAAIKLGIFPLLEQPISAREVSDHLKANPGFVEAFLESCAGLGLLEKEEGNFKNSQVASKFLIPDKPEYQGDYIVHITNFWYTWGNLDQLIREGRPDFPFENGFVDAATYWTSYIKGRHNLAMAGQGAVLAEYTNLNNRRKMLDLGGGSGSYSIALCNANPNLTAVVVDLKEPLEIALSLLKQYNLQERITLCPADFHTTEFDQDYDVVLLSAVLRHISPEQCLRLLSKAYDALLPGGLLIVQEFINPEDNPKQSLRSTMMELYLMIGFHSESGNRSKEEIALWLEKTGFKNIKVIPLPTQTTLILGEKP